MMPIDRSQAERIAEHLGDARCEGSGWKCRCPVCSGRLSLRDGVRGLLPHCWGGCATRDVFAALRHLGLLSGERPAPLSADEIARREAVAARERRRKIAAARELWNEGQPIEGTLADTYLRCRGLDVLSTNVEEAVAVLRFHPRAWHSPGIFRPALLAKVEHVEEGHVATHATFLAMDGSGKTTLDPPRKSFGPVGGSAVRLGTPRPDRWLVIGEGVETVLSVAQSRALPAWAALSAGGIYSLILPRDVRMVLIAADNDLNGAGQRAADASARRFRAEGRRVRIVLPPVGRDFNDVLIGRVASQLVGVDHAR